jgi:hypothetical protein
MHKTVRLIFILFFIISTSIANAQNTLNLQDGFSGVKWGTDVSKMPNFSEVSRNDEIGYFVRAGEVYIMDGIQLGQVTYGSYQKQFFAAYLRITSADQLEQVKESLTFEYGNARAQLRIDTTIYIWEFKNIKIKLKFFDKHNNHKLAFYYTPLSKKLNESRSEKGFEKIRKLE